MESKDVRNLIIALVVLIIGIFFMMNIAQAYLTPFMKSYTGVSTGLVTSMSSFGVLISIGIGAITLILIPIWLWMRSSEKQALAAKQKIEFERQQALRREQQLTSEIGPRQNTAQQPVTTQRQQPAYNSQKQRSYRYYPTNQAQRLQYQQRVQQKRISRPEPSQDFSNRLSQHRFARRAASSYQHDLDVADEYRERIRKKRSF